jgi:hypothetical protein
LRTKCLFFKTVDNNFSFAYIPLAELFSSLLATSKQPAADMRASSMIPYRAMALALIVFASVFSIPAHSGHHHHSSHHKDGVQCHLPNLQNAIDCHQHPLTKGDEFPPKFIEFSCSPEGKRYGKCTKLGGIGNNLILFPAVYVFAMLSGREVVIHDSSGLGNWCRALNCGFQFTSDAERAFPDLKKITNVEQFTQNDFAYKLRSNISIPNDIVGFRGMDVYATKWFHYAGPLARPCVEEITGNQRKLISDAAVKLFLSNIDIVTIALNDTDINTANV